ncbi:phage tail protein [Lactiplantibacillus plantarum]|uniref:phage tail protein n=1 Tax=Lactiplantibacillus plantarum TaxID=1590 RepID=UPI00338F3D0F
MLWLKDTNGDQTAISGSFEVAITETQGSFDRLSFKFIVDPTNVQDPNYVASTMMLPRTIVVEPITGKKFRILQSQPESLGDKLLYTVTCASIAYDLHDMYVETKLQNTQSLTACLKLITSGTGFKYHVTGSFANYNFGEGFGGDFADTLLSNLASDFAFKYYFDNYDIYIKSTIGSSGAFLFVENANAAKFTRQEDYSTITTYIKGYGKQNDNGSHATTADYTSPLASNWGKIWASPYSSDSITNQATLLAKLKSEIHDYPDVQYTMSYTDFINNVQGFKNDATPGNYGWLRNRFGIDVSVMVQSRTWYPQEQDRGQSGSITFGNKIFDPNYFWQQLRNGYQANLKLGQELKTGQITLEEYYQQLKKSYQDQSATITDLNQRINGLESNGIFVDVSSNNADTSVDWFTKLVNYGAKGLMVKLTQSTDYTNALATTQIANGKSTGLNLVGCYHYFMGSGAAEGEAFLAQLQANSIPTSAVVALDIEDSTLNPTVDNAAITKAELNAQISAFYKVLTDAGYTNTCDYASASSFDVWFDSTAKYKWMASWGADSKPSGADAWQFDNNWHGWGVDANYGYKGIFN